MKFSVFQVSRRGGREINEDRVGYSYTRNASLFLLADGMGGHPEGEVASQLAVQVMTAFFQHESVKGIADVRMFLGAAVLGAHRQIVRYAADKKMDDSPRTTLVAAMILDGDLSWVHCGDSRLYMVRDGELLARTRDHSYLEQRRGQIPTSRSGEVLNRNVLFSCLGSPSVPNFEITGPVTLLEGDKILLCSDGLWGSLSDAEIVRDMALHAVSHSVPNMVDKALDKGGKDSDNVSVIALEWETPSALDTIHGSVSTESIDPGVFASTVQASGFDLDSLGEEMDDDAIERSIIEINEAIKRSAARKG